MNLDREHTIVVKHRTLITVNLSLLHSVLYDRSLTIVLEIDYHRLVTEETNLSS